MTSSTPLSPAAPAGRHAAGRVLLLAEGYPPDPRVGAFRARKVARALAAAGHEVHVLAMRAGETQGGELDPGVMVHVVKPWRSPMQMVRALVTGRSDSGETPVEAATAMDGAGGNGGPGTTSPEEVGGLKRAVFAILKTPDEWQGIVPAMGRFADALGEQRFDLIYSTSPAFSISLAGLALARRWRKPWVMELRDPWRGSGSSRIAEASAVSDWIDRRLYDACVKRASLLVTVADGAAELLRKHVGPARAGQVLSVLNGIDAIETDRPARTAGRPLRIVYAGSVYPPRDPAPLVQALSRVMASAAVDVELVFVGVTTPAEVARVRSFTAGSLESRTEIRHWLPQPEVRALIRDADLVLLPGQRWERQIPNKLFDYLGARVPILALVEPDSEPERMLAAVGGHHVLRTTDSAERADVVARAALETAAGERRPVGDEAVLSEWLVSRQQARLVAAVESLIARTTARRSPQ